MRSYNDHRSLGGDCRIERETTILLQSVSIQFRNTKKKNLQKIKIGRLHMMK
jgi:hypothetical protein